MGGRQRLGGLHVRRQRGIEGDFRLRQDFDERRHLRSDPIDKAFQPLAFHRLHGRIGKRRPHATQTRRGPWAAQHGRFERARERAERAGIQTASGQRMFQQSQERHGREMLRHHRREQAQECAGRRRGQRHAGGIVDLDVPPAQFRCHAAREVTIGRDQSRRLTRRLQRVAQAQRDDAGLLHRPGTINPFQPTERILRDRALGAAPRVAGCRRPHGLGQQHAARQHLQAMPGRHPVARHLEPLEKEAERELRMARLQLFPTLAIHRRIEAGQHHAPLGQARDHR